MRISVYGLWHLGCVTAACLSDYGHEVVGVDEPNIVGGLNLGVAPISEPGLNDLISSGLTSGKLTFESDLEKVFGGSRVVWITFDTPVNDADEADSKFVIDKIIKIIPFIDSNSMVLISSQLPIGSSGLIQEKINTIRPNDNITVSYSPENLRLGKAIDVFKNPDRVVVGLDDIKKRGVISTIFSPETKIEWMSVKSAEMTKHAINSFLALSIVFINELSSVCESFGADISEVERGLKTEHRIGPRSYLRAGLAFDGGTLARDVQFLKKMCDERGLDSCFFDGILNSNLKHKQWSIKKIEQIFPDLNNVKIGVFGIAYKKGTDTTRRSQSLEMCKQLSDKGATVFAMDPLVKLIGSEATLINTPDMMNDCDVIVINMIWDDVSEHVYGYLSRKTIIDPSGLLDGKRFEKYHRIGFSK